MFLVRHGTKFVWMRDCQIARPDLSLYRDAHPHIVWMDDRACNYTYTHTLVKGGGADELKDGRQKGENRVCKVNGLLRS